MNSIKIVPFLCLLILVFVLPCCYSAREEVIQKDDACHFKFMGNVEDALVSVLDNGRAVWTDIAVEEDKRYTIKPGTYEVKVTRDGILVVRRTLFLAGSNTVEINIP